MYQCSAKCCENKNLSVDDVQRCIEDCSQKVNKAQSYLQLEIESFQVSIFFTHNLKVLNPKGYFEYSVYH